MMRHGQITDEIKQRSRQLLGYAVDYSELHLMPYLLHTLIYNKRLDRKRINKKEYEIIKKWEFQRFIKFNHPTDTLRIRKQFWDACCELVGLAYVEIDQ
jgi:hypothetical protein